MLCNVVIEKKYNITFNNLGLQRLLGGNSSNTYFNGHFADHDSEFFLQKHSMDIECPYPMTH